MAFDYEIDFNLANCINTMGLEEGGRVQQFVTNEFMKNAEPFVPFDISGKYENPGQLKDSVHIENETDVVWNTPFARKMYYHEEYNFQGSPVRGAYWANRYLQDGGQKELEDGARKVVKQ